MTLESLEQVRARYEFRVCALLTRWRDACEDEGWTTTDIHTITKVLPGDQRSHLWSFDAAIAAGRRAHVSVLLESETAPTDDIGFVAVVRCAAFVGFTATGGGWVKLHWPDARECLGDDESFEQGFAALEAVDGIELVDAINRHDVR